MNTFLYYEGDEEYNQKYVFNLSELKEILKEESYYFDLG